MLRKVIKVRGLGRIRALDWGNLPEIQKLALVFADNGTGKTTLAAALRAARDGSRIPIHERRTLGLGETVLVQLLTTGGTVAYDGSQWNQKLEKLDIFDRFFVETNVFIGSDIGPDQRHNLYRLALGASEVKAARALEEQNVGLKS